MSLPPHRHSRRVLLALLASLFLLSPSVQAHRAAFPRSMIEVEATLINAGRTPPACGRIYGIGVAQFRLTRTLRGTVSAPEFWVAISCGGMNTTEVGRAFRVRLFERAPQNTGTLFWPNYRPETPLYWAVERPQPL